MARLVGVFGTAGFGREIMPLVQKQLWNSMPDDRVTFVGTDSGHTVSGAPVIAEDEFFNSSQERAFVIAIADGSIRQRLFELALISGAEPLEVRAASCEVFEEVQLGAGAILCGHSSITSNTSVGLGFHLNISSYLAHDCICGDFVTFGPNVVCAGNVTVEDGAYIGGGAMVRQGTPNARVVIGAGAVIGMGAVVTKSVKAGAVVAGNPAREIN